jgi:hypothetical protein
LNAAIGTSQWKSSMDSYEQDPWQSVWGSL